MTLTPFLRPPCFVAWCVIVFIVLRRYRRGGLWGLIGAPFATETFVRVVIYVVGSFFYYGLGRS